MQLGSVEIPAERAGDETAEHGAERIKPPRLQLRALAARTRRSVESKVDAGIGQRADGERDEETRAAVRGREIDGIGERAAEPTTAPRA